MKVRDCTPDEREALLHNRCPDCGNYGFHDGPRGGASQNIFCCNPHCRSAFNVAPVPLLIMAQRIPRGPLAFYPPLNHATVPTPNGTLPLCAFSLRTPSEWPRGHREADIDREVTCPDCIAGLRDAMRPSTVAEMIRRFTGK
jgi:hypothetical protein